MNSFHEEKHYPPHMYANQRLITAVKIALRFKNKAPTIASLRAEFGMSRATAYRWRNAFMEARNEAIA